MKKIIICKNDSGQRLDKFLLKTFPKLPKALMYKEIRKKNIKINRKRADAAAIIEENDCIELYLKDEVLEEKERHYDFMQSSKELSVIYEDNNIIILDKKPGLLCHPDGKEFTDTLISRIKRYLYEKGEWNPQDSTTFTPALANRIDRNTGGLVIAAKNAKSLRELNRKIKEREIKKYYLTVVHGKLPKKEDTLNAYLIKNEKTNTVTVLDYEIKGSKKITTSYRVLSFKNGKSLLEIDLITGRTHQIRAHLAHIGNPLVNDGKYGKNQGRFRQMLYSYKIIFEPENDSVLSYLSGKEFKATDCRLYDDFKENKI